MLNVNKKACEAAPGNNRLLTVPQAYVQQCMLHSCCVDLQDGVTLSGNSSESIPKMIWGRSSERTEKTMPFGVD